MRNLVFLILFSICVQLIMSVPLPDPDADPGANPDADPDADPNFFGNFLGLFGNPRPSRYPFNLGKHKSKQNIIAYNLETQLKQKFTIFLIILECSGSCLM
jgi:hypothetical protein